MREYEKKEKTGCSKSIFHPTLLALPIPLIILHSSPYLPLMQFRCLHFFLFRFCIFVLSFPLHIEVLINVANTAKIVFTSSFKGQAYLPYLPCHLVHHLSRPNQGIFLHFELSSLLPQLFFSYYHPHPDTYLSSNP